MSNEIAASKQETPEFSFWEGMAYAMGAIGLQLTTVMVDTWARFFYHPPQGDASRITYLSLTGAANMILMGRFLGAFSDPLVGLWSDNARFRWGRRKPFIALGSIPMVLIFILLWFPPVSHDSPLNFWWGLVLVAGFWLTSTCVFVPYAALVPEIATTTHGRVKLMVYNSVAMIIGLVLGEASGPLIGAFGYRVTALVFGIVSLICFQITGWGIKERFKGQAQITSAKQLLMEFVYCFKNRAFLVFVASQSIFSIGFFLIYSVLPDFNDVVLNKKEDFVLYLYLPFLLTCTPMVFFMPNIVKKWGKRKVYGVSLLSLALLLPFLAVTGLMPTALTKIAMALFLVGVVGIPHAAYYAVPNSFIGEIADYDEQCITGRRREAIYNGAQSFANKVAMSLTFFMQSRIYRALGGLRKDNPRAVLAMGPVTGVVCFMAFLVFALFYPKLHVVKDERTDTAA